MARILLAEKDERIRTFIAGILSEFGHEVTACADCREAGARMAGEPVDVVLTDLVLCGRHGARCAANWATLGIPTVTLSGREFHTGEPTQQRLMPLVDTPFRFAHLRCVLDAVEAYSARPHRPVRNAA